MNNKVLIVEDDVETASFLAGGLGEAGFVTDWEQDGGEGLARALGGGYDMVILDRMLPSMDGLAVLQSLRERRLRIPVIILSAIGSTDERVKGLRAGSDDYLVKPFAISELVARMEALQRRSTQSEALSHTRLTCCDLAMDLISGRVERAGNPIALQPREFRLLQFLMRNEGHVVTRTMVLEEVWGYNFDPGTNVVDVHISNLRKKIDANGLSSILHTIRGMGYMLGKIG